MILNIVLCIKYTSIGNKQANCFGYLRFQHKCSSFHFGLGLLHKPDWKQSRCKKAFVGTWFLSPNDLSAWFGLLASQVTHPLQIYQPRPGPMLRYISHTGHRPSWSRFPVSLCTWSWANVVWLGFMIHNSEASVLSWIEVGARLLIYVDMHVNLNVTKKLRSSRVRILAFKFTDQLSHSTSLCHDRLHETSQSILDLPDERINTSKALFHHVENLDKLAIYTCLVHLENPLNMMKLSCLGELVGFRRLRSTNLLLLRGPFLVRLHCTEALVQIPGRLTSGLNTGVKRDSSQPPKEIDKGHCQTQGWMPATHYFANIHSEKILVTDAVSMYAYLCQLWPVFGVCELLRNSALPCVFPTPWSRTSTLSRCHTCSSCAAWCWMFF